MKLVLAATGASGAIYTQRLLDRLDRSEVRLEPRDEVVAAALAVTTPMVHLEVPVATTPTAHPAVLVGMAATIPTARTLLAVRQAVLVPMTPTVRQDRQGAPHLVVPANTDWAQAGQGK